MSFKALTVNTPPEKSAHILAEDDAAIYAGIIGADCVLNEGGKMAASVISNNKVRITDGVVVVGGHVGRIVKGDYEDMTIANGVSGKNRNDLIVARFLAGSNGGADTFSLVVVQGASGTSAVDPTVVKGDLYNGDKQRDLPLWRVKIEGLSIVKVEQLFEIGMTNKDLLNRINALNTNLLNKIAIGSNKNTTMVITDQIIKFSNGTATLLMQELASEYGKTIRSAMVQLKSASTAVITSAIVSNNSMTVKCSNLSGTGFSGEIACTVILFLS